MGKKKLINLSQHKKPYGDVARDINECLNNSDPNILGENIIEQLFSHSQVTVLVNGQFFVSYCYYGKFELM